MSLSIGLLELAQRILAPAKGRPHLAVLRRAISTAYYAVFHRLIEESTKLIAGTSAPRAIRHVVARSFGHEAMRRLAKSIASSSLPDVLKSAIERIPPDLQLVTESFVHLQEMG